MRVAALCDVHGNLPALEAVLAEVAALEVDRIVCGGDVVSGPFPIECLDSLLDREAIFVRGNGDRDPTAVPPAWEEAGRWVAAQLGPAALEFLRELPHEVAFGGVRYCHGSPRDDNEILTRVSPDDRFRAALAGVSEHVVVGGHTHVQFERDVDAWHFVNAGSVGMPYEGRQGAFWALLHGEAVELKHTPYAVDAALAAITTSGYPGAEDLCGTLANPPDPDEVSAYFESVAA
jgi:putative phosphoesterase